MDIFKNKKWIAIFFNILLLGSLLLFFLVSGDLFPDTEKSKNVTVFVLDTRVDNDFLEKKTALPGEEISHGSIVARIIKEEASRSRIIPIPVDIQGELSKELYLKALTKVLDYKNNNPTKEVLVNISLAFRHDDLEHDEMIKLLKERGILVIAAAGNDDSKKPIYPAGYEEVVAVANATVDSKASSSNYGEYIDIAAPGDIKYILNLYFPGNNMIQKFKAVGTSFSAPRVVGLTARLLIEKPSLSPEEALQIIKETAQPIKDPLYQKGQLGRGVIDSTAALSKVLRNYRIKMNLLKWGLPILVAIILLIIIHKYGLGSVFIVLLFLLVVVPILIWIGATLISSVEYLTEIPLQYIVGFIGLITIAQFNLLWWDNRFILKSYGVIFLLPIMSIPFVADYLPDIIGYYLFFVLGYSMLMNLVGALKLRRMKLWDTDYDLIYQQLGSYSNKVNSFAIDKLAEWGDFGWVRSRLLETDNQRKIIGLITILGQLGKGRELLIKYIDHDSKRVRQATLKALARLESPPINLILGQLNHNNQDTLESIFLENSENIIPQLLKVLKKKSSDQKISLAKRILKKFPGREAVGYLKEVLEDQKAPGKVAILEITAHYKKEVSQLVPYVVKILMDSHDMWIRYQALNTLAAIHEEPKKLIPALESLKKDEQELVSLEAEGLLAELKTK
mgnify:CR=1 FL=1